MRTALAAVFGILLAAVATAMTPPLTATIEVGVDGKGRPWSVVTKRGAPLTLVGPGAPLVATGTEDLGMDFVSVIDGQDRLWVADLSGKAAEIRLADGKARRFDIPTEGVLARGLVFHQGGLWFAERAGGDERLARYDVRNAAKKGMPVAAGPLTSFAVAGGRAWTIGCSPPSQPDWSCTLTGIDVVTGQVLASERRAGRRLAEPRSDEVAAGADGSVWIASGGSGTVHRRDPSGAWKDWSFGRAVPSDLRVSGGHGVLLLTTYVTDPPSANAPPFGAVHHTSRPATAELAAIDAAGTATRLAVTVGRRLFEAPGGGPVLVPGGRVVLTAAGLQLRED